MESESASPWESILNQVLKSYDDRRPTLVEMTDEVEGVPELPGSGGTAGADSGTLALGQVFPSWRHLAVPGRSLLGTAVAEGAALGPVITTLGFDSVAARRMGASQYVEPYLLGAEIDPPAALAVIAPESFLSSQAWSEARALLMGRYQVAWILSGPADVRELHHSFRFGCLVLRDAVNKPEARFFKVVPGAKRSRVLSDLDRLIKVRGGSTGLGFVHREDLPPGASLAFDRYSPEIKQRLTALRHFGELVPLGSLFEVLPGRAMLRGAREAAQSSESPAAMHTVVRGRDVVHGLNPESLEKSPLIDPSSAVELRRGDHLVPQIVSRRGTLAVARFDSHPEPVFAYPTVLVLRPMQSVHPAVIDAALLYLRSDVAFRLLTAGGSNIPRVTPSTLRDLPVPMLDEPLIQALSDLESAKNQFLTWADEAEALRLGIFTDADTASVRDALLDAGRTTRRRVEGAKSLDDPAVLIRTTYPYPIAYRWRTVEASRTGPDHFAAYREVLQSAEVLFAYAGSLALAMARANQLELASLEQLRNKLKAGAGISFGDWVQVLDEASTSRDSQAMANDAPMAGIQRFLKADGVTGARVRLKKRRDDEAHLRGVSGPQLESALNAAMDDLQLVLMAAGMLSEMKLVHVVSSRLDTLNNRAVVVYRELMGDHPAVPHRSMITSEMSLEVGSLYVLEGRARWHLLRPFLIGRECPECHNWSTFSLDKCSVAAPVIKSLEHGHVQSVPELGEAFESVGLPARSRG